MYHSFMLKKIKLLYSPGLISIFGLLFFIMFLFKKLLPKPASFITYFSPKDTKPHDWSITFSKYTILDEVKRKRKIQITLDADKLTNQKKLSLIRYEAQKLKYTNDTSAVILITLKNDITYGEFITLLDLCQMDDHSRFAAFDDKFVIFGATLPPVNIQKLELPYISL